MSTPLWNAVEAYLNRDAARFHMPGHKGAALPPLGDAVRYDITEVAGADSLYEASGPIARTESAFAQLYGAKRSLLSAGGSTLCIQTMLALAARPGDTVVCGRGVHTAAVNAMALLDLRPAWIFPGADPLSGLSQAVTASQVEAALQSHPGTAAVYLTSPSYYGVLCDVEAVSAVCRAHGVPLLVDNAHGAHLRFLPRSLHPINLGADMCCDSLHKTLPVLTGGALLHIQTPYFIPDAKRRMSLFGSTSPSYLIMLSADAALPYLERIAASDFRHVAGLVADLGESARARGFHVPGSDRDPARLTLDFSRLGLTAVEFGEHLARCGIEPEFCAGGVCVFLASGHNRPGDYERLRYAIETAPAGGAGSRPAQTPGVFAPPKQALPLREAVFAPARTVAVERAAGRVAAAAVAPCPPGIPLVVPGESIDEALVACLKGYGILSIDVIQ